MAGGYRSLLAFWLGGAAAGVVVKVFYTATITTAPSVTASSPDTSTSVTASEPDVSVSVTATPKINEA